MRYSKLTLRFTGTDAALEPAFIASFNASSLLQARVLLPLGTLLVGAFGFLDAYLVPSMKYFNWGIRFGILCPALFIGLLCALEKRFAPYLPALLVFLVVLTASGFDVMILHNPAPANYFYYSGLILVLMYGYTLMRLRFIWASLAGWIVVVLYESAAMLTSTPMPILVNNTFFLVSSNIIGMLSSYAIERSARRDFYLTQNLTQEQKNVVAVNAQLEERVEERTEELRRTNEELFQQVQTRVEAEGALRESEERYRLLVNNSEFPVLVASLDSGAVLFTNERCRKFLAFREEDSHRSVIDIWVSAEDRAQFMSNLTTRGRVTNHETELRSAAGEPRWVLISANVLTYLGRRSAFMVFGDITERKRIEREALKAREDLSMLNAAALKLVQLPPGEREFDTIGEILETAVDAAFVIVTEYQERTDSLVCRTFRAPGSIIKRAAEILGASPIGTSVKIEKEEARQIMLSGKLTRLPGGTFDLLFERVPRPIMETAERMFGIGEIYVVGFSYRGELFGDAVIGLREGAGIDAALIETFANQASVAIRRRRAEEALRESEIRYRELVETAQDMIFTLSSEGHFTSVNTSFVNATGWAPQEVLGKHFSRIIHPEDVNAAAESFGNRLQGGPPSSLELRAIRKTGELSSIEIVSAPQLNDGTIVGLTCIGRDVSERKRLEDQVRVSQKMESIGLLAGGIAHDFNNILNIIIGNAELVARDPSNMLKLPKRVDAIRRTAERGGQVVKQLLAFARRTEIRYESTDLNGVVLDTVRFIGETFPRIITIETVLDPDLPLVHADSNQVHQVILNMCINARDAMASGGTLRINTMVTEGNVVRGRFAQAEGNRYVSVAIRDTGSGMSEEILERIFEPFFTTKDIGKGTGLGLAVAYGIVESHDGFIDVWSEVGKGSMFTIHLPLSDGKAPERKEKLQNNTTPLGNGERILIIDDEELIRETMLETLGEHGYDVILARDGQDGLSIFERRAGEIDLVISDFGMPAMQGDVVFQKMKELKPGVRFILMTGLIDQSKSDELVQKGIMAVVSKPFVGGEMLAAIGKAL
jgi:PAS domain S-box-containing protein